MSFFPGRVHVTFRKGARGYLLEGPTHEAQLIKDKYDTVARPVPLSEDIVRQNALTVVRERGGDASDRQEVFGEYVLQFGKYQGKSFRWLLENDMGYTIYLISDLQKTEAAGVHVRRGHDKVSLQSFVDYAQSFDDIQSLLRYKSLKPPVDDDLVRFGKHQDKTCRWIWDNRANGYAAAIMNKDWDYGTFADKLKRYLLMKMKESASVSSATVPASSVSIEGLNYL